MSAIYRIESECTKTKTYRCGLRRESHHQDTRMLFAQIQWLYGFFLWMLLFDIETALFVQMMIWRLTTQKKKSIFFFQISSFSIICLVCCSFFVKTREKNRFGVSFHSAQPKVVLWCFYGKEKSIIINKIRSFLAQIFSQITLHRCLNIPRACSAILWAQCIPTWKWRRLNVSRLAREHNQARKKKRDREYKAQQNILDNRV